MLEQIKNQIFKETGEKLDAYSLAIIRANILAIGKTNIANIQAMNKVIESNNQLTAKLKEATQPIHYHGVDKMNAFKVSLLRNGWTAWLALTAALAFGTMLLYNYMPTTRERALKSLPSEVSKLQFGEDGGVRVSQTDYTVIKGGIRINE